MGRAPPTIPPNHRRNNRRTALTRTPFLRRGNRLQLTIPIQGPSLCEPPSTGRYPGPPWVRRGEPCPHSRPHLRRPFASNRWRASIPTGHRHDLALERGSGAPQTAAGTNIRTRLPISARNRRPLVLLASLVMVLTSIAVFADIYASSNHQTSVLIVTVPIQQGQEFSGNDLGQASLSVANGVSAIPVADAAGAHG